MAGSKPVALGGAMPWVGAALLLSALGGGVLWRATALPPGGGFEASRWAGPRCEGPVASQRRVREPLQLLENAAGHCTRYQSWLSVDRLRDSEMEFDARGEVRVWVDERLVFEQRLGKVARSRRAAVRLTQGVHSLVVEHHHPGGEGYLRMREHDTRDSHYKYVLSPLDAFRYYATPDAAHWALEVGMPVPAPLRAVFVFAALLLAAFCAWRGLGVARGQTTTLSRGELGSALLVSLLGFVVRAARIPQQDCTWDELAYSIAGRHMVRNLLVQDLSGRAFRWNYPHPPVAKWIYGIAWELGGHEGARLVSALLGALAIGVLYGIGRLLFDRETAWVGALVACFMPHLVAHARLTGLESPLVLFWSAALLCALLWRRSLPDMAAGEDSDPRGARLAAFCVPLWVMLAIATRMTAVWVVPLLVGVLIHGLRGDGIRPGRVLWPVWFGTLCGLLILWVSWVYLWEDPVASWERILTRWKGQHTTEFFLGEDRRPPPAGYYFAAFLATTPVAALLAGGAGVFLGIRNDALRAATLFCVGWLLWPFAQSVSSFRQDLARYVIPAWPALCLLAALGAVQLGRWLRGRFAEGSVVAARLWASLPASVLVGATLLSLAAAEPYPLDYYNRAVGGAAGVFRSRSFEVAYWGEGARAAIDWVNANAPEGSRVHLQLTPDDTPPRLRDDLVRSRAKHAHFLVQNHYKYRARPPAGCERAHRVGVDGAPLVDVYDCRAR